MRFVCPNVELVMKMWLLHIISSIFFAVSCSQSFTRRLSLGSSLTYQLHFGQGYRATGKVGKDDFSSFLRFSCRQGFHREPNTGLFWKEMAVWRILQFPIILSRYPNWNGYWWTDIKVKKMWRVYLFQSLTFALAPQPGTVEIFGAMCLNLLFPLWLNVSMPELIRLWCGQSHHRNQCLGLITLIPSRRSALSFIAHNSWLARY